MGRQRKTAGRAFSAGGSFADNLAEADAEKQKGFIGAIASGKLIIRRRRAWSRR